jgi:F-type H+-transporting ATPase subunit a
MASDVLHIKDSYYFEVPKALWPRHYESLGEVPDFLVELHAEDFHLRPETRDYDTLSPEEYTAEEQHALEEFSHQLSGKILIPQPPGTELKTLYAKESGFAISKFMIIELLVAGLMLAIFIWLRKKMTAGEPTKGKIANLFEALLHFVRDKIAKPAIGHDADKFVPLLWTIFFFIIFCNLLGLVPWMGTVTASFGANLALAFGVLLTTFLAGFRAFGPKWLWSGFVPHMDLPVFLQPLKLMIYAIEVLGMFIKHSVLAIRLLANMAAGHVVLLAILGMIVAAAQANSDAFHLTATIALIGAICLTVLEFGVALLQAYVFTLLSALFIGSAAHEH